MLILIIAGAAYGYFFWFTEGTLQSADLRNSPCSIPVRIGIGDIDNRFNISHSELQSAISEVALLWSDAAGKTVAEFSNDNNTDISVHLVYAGQQQLTDQERQFSDRLRSERIQIDVMEREYNKKNKRYEEDVSEYEEATRRHQQNIEKLNRWVRQNNDSGGFNEDNLRHFQSRKAEIDRISEQLNRTQSRLITEADELNRMIDELNRKINRKNRLVDEYNETFSGTRKFTQGTYEWNENERSIFIYQFKDMDELKLVLAHEVGHALGIDHVSNPESVMHAMMGNQKSGGLVLTNEDKIAVLEACSEVES